MNNAAMGGISTGFVIKSWYYYLLLPNGNFSYHGATQESTAGTIGLPSHRTIITKKTIQVFNTESIMSKYQFFL